MEVGDTFTITILNREITYEVDDISIILPNETDSLQIEDKKEYCTLMTCTPYGINTHRLLVRGTLCRNRRAAAYSCYDGGVPDRSDDYGICYRNCYSDSSFGPSSYPHPEKGE